MGVARAAPVRVRKSRRLIRSMDMAIDGNCPVGRDATHLEPFSSKGTRPVRGLAKSYGERLRGCNGRNMNPEKAQELSPELQRALEPLLAGRIFRDAI